jgi:hypothetical protein
MPPRKRTDTPAEAPVLEEPILEAPAPESEPAVADQDPQPEPDHQPAARKPRKPAAEPPCPTCFPNGWPDEATSAGCSHGTWDRTL